MTAEAVGVYFEQPVPYSDAVRLQEALVSARQANRIPDTVLFLEHPPVVTLGRRGRTNFLLRSPDQLRSAGIELHHASRGGDVTYHAPGQLVIYPILRLAPAPGGSHNYLWRLEEIAIRTAGDFGIRAYRREGKNGAWTDRGKLAAIGFHLKRWVTMHGMSFNVKLDLAGFSYIVGCGLVGERVTSLAEMLGDRCPPLSTVRDRMAANAADVLGLRLACVAWNRVPHGEVRAIVGAALNISAELTVASLGPPNSNLSAKGGCAGWEVC